MSGSLYIVECIRAPESGYYITAIDKEDAVEKVTQKVRRTLGDRYVEGYLKVHTITKVR